LPGFEQVTDFDQQLFLRARFRRFLFLGAVHGVDQFHQQKDREGDDQEIERYWRKFP